METTPDFVCSDRLSIAVGGGIQRVAASGIFGPSGVASAVERVKAAAMDPSVRVLVVDLRAAALALTAGEYLSLVRWSLKHPIAQPVAFIVSDELMSYACAHQILMARRGLDRRFFSTDEKALRWAARHVPASVCPAPCR